MQIWKKSIVLLVLPLVVFAYVQTGLPFLTIYPGARAVGMGGAFTAIADDAMATYYNPAGLSFQSSIDVHSYFCNWLPGLYPGMYHIYEAISIPVMKELTVAPFVNYLTTGKTEVIDFNGNYLGCYTTYDLAIGISAGIRPLSVVGLGVSVKYLHSFLVPPWVFQRIPELGDEGGGTARTFATDCGILYSQRTILGKSNIGLNIQNIGPGIKYTEVGETEPLPSAIRVGIAHTIDAKTLFPNTQPEFWLTEWFLEKARISFAGDVYQGLVGLPKPWLSIGMEFAPLAIFSFRCGYFIDSDGARKGLTYGAGLDCKFLKIDIGSDADIYDFETENWRINAIINIGTPFISEEGLKGLFKKH